MRRSVCEFLFSSSRTQESSTRSSLGAAAAARRVPPASSPPGRRHRVTTRGVEGKNAASGNENHPHLTLAPALPLNIL